MVIKKSKTEREKDRLFKKYTDVLKWTENHSEFDYLRLRWELAKKVKKDGCELEDSNNKSGQIPGVTIAESAYFVVRRIFTIIFCSALFALPIGIFVYNLIGT